MESSRVMTVVPLANEDEISIESIIVVESTEDFIIRYSVPEFFWFWVVLTMFAGVISLAITDTVVLTYYLHFSTEVKKYLVSRNSSSG